MAFRKSDASGHHIAKFGCRLENNIVVQQQA